jgi:hypothetical protein
MGGLFPKEKEFLVRTFLCMGNVSLRMELNPRPTTPYALENRSNQSWNAGLKDPGSFHGGRDKQNRLLG